MSLISTISKMLLERVLMVLYGMFPRAKSYSAIVSVTEPIQVPPYISLLVRK